MADVHTGQNEDTAGNQRVALAQWNSTTPLLNLAAASTLTYTGNDPLLGTLAFPMLYNGSGWSGERTPARFVTINAVAIGSEATIWTPAAGKKFRLMGLVLFASATAIVTLNDNTAGTTIAIVYAAATSSNTPAVPVTFGNGILSSAANHVLTATGSTATNLSGMVWGTEE